MRGWPGGSPTAATPPREMKFKIVTILPCTADEYITHNDTSEYKKLQLETTNSFERTNVTTCKDGVCTQVIVNKPSIDIPRVVKFMMKGREMEFTDTRTWEDRVKKEGRFPLTQTFLQTNNITDRCLSKGTITVEDVEVAEEEEGAGTKAKKAGGAKKAQEKKTKRCSITAEGEVIVRIGPLSNFAEGQVIEHMRAAYGKFPGIVERWREILAEREKTKAAKAAEEEDAISAERLVAEDATVSEDAEDAVMTDALDSTATTATATATRAAGRGWAGSGSGSDAAAAAARTGTRRAARRTATTAGLRARTRATSGWCSICSSTTSWVGRTTSRCCERSGASIPGGETFNLRECAPNEVSARLSHSCVVGLSGY